MATREKPREIFWFDLETTGLGEKGNTVLPYHLAGILTDANLNELGRIELFFRVPGDFVWEPYAFNMAKERGLVLTRHEPNVRQRIRNQEGDPAFYAVEGKPSVTYEHGLELLTRWLNDRKSVGSISPAGQNIASFDLPILRKLWHAVNDASVPQPGLLTRFSNWVLSRKPAKRTGVLTYAGGWPFDYHPIDTCVYAGFDYWFANNEVNSVSLVPMCEHVGIQLSEQQAHNAMNDVEATLALGRIFVERCRRAKTA